MKRLKRSVIPVSVLLTAGTVWVCANGASPTRIDRRSINQPDDKPFERIIERFNRDLESAERDREDLQRRLARAEGALASLEQNVCDESGGERSKDRGAPEREDVDPDQLDQPDQPDQPDQEYGGVNPGVPSDTDTGESGVGVPRPRSIPIAASGSAQGSNSTFGLRLRELIGVQRALRHRLALLAIRISLFQATDEALDHLPKEAPKSSEDMGKSTIPVGTSRATSTLPTSDPPFRSL